MIDSSSMPLPAPADLPAAIRRLKDDLHAVILAHYYQQPEIQDIADVIGDSLELSRAAARADAEVLVFAGVHFMAETAKLLNPDKLVLLPDVNAGCSLAESAPAYLFRQLRRQHPDHLAITYINSTAEVKALSDIVCTSSSAERILAAVPPEVPVLFAPDKHLGRWLSRTLRRPLLLWQGACTVHEQFSEAKLSALREDHPRARLVAHPECEDAVLARADFVGSTSALLRHVQERPETEFIVATEAGILHQMRKTCPDKVFIAAPPDAPCACNECPYMKLNTMEKLYRCMRDRAPSMEVHTGVADGALAAIERMMLLSTADTEHARRIIDAIPLPFAG
jgi:quinolinate synthase